MTRFTPVANVSSFRRMAAGMWRSPRDPSIYGQMDVDATAALAFLAAQPGRVTITHLVARGVALALRDQPEINAKVRYWGRLEQRDSIDLFVTVATGRDLSGARIDRADTKSLTELAREVGDRAGKIRKGDDPDHARTRGAMKAIPWWLARPTTWISDMLVNELHVDLPGMPGDPFGSAIITSVGMFGIDAAFAPFVPLARCPMLILVPEVRPRPWAVGDRAEVRPVLRLCATFDHRIIDGAAAGRFAARLTTLFDSPELLA